jgi:hypothetical protein
MIRRLLGYFIDWLIAFLIIFQISSIGIGILWAILELLTIKFPFDFEHVSLHIILMSCLGAAYSVLFSPVK